MLSTRMAVDGTKIVDMARVLGLSRSYLSQLLASEKEFSGVGNDVLRAVARYLELPPVVCFVLAGKLEHADFLEPKVEYEAQLRAALEVIAESTFALEAAVDKSMLWSLQEPVKLLLVLLYQAVSGADVVAQKKRWPWTASKESSIFSVVPR